MDSKAVLNHFCIIYMKSGLEVMNGKGDG